MLSKLSRIAGAAVLFAGIATQSQAAQGPDAGVVVNAPAEMARECTKVYMVAGKTYYIVHEEDLRLVFERGRANPYSLQAIFSSPTRLLYERVYVQFQPAGNGTQVVAFHQTFAPVASRYEDQSVAPEPTKQDMTPSSQYAAKLAEWINSKKSANECY